VALAEQLEVAGVDYERGARVAPNDLAEGDVVRPGRSAACLAGERVEHAGRLRGPGTSEGRGGEGAEVAAVGALGLDDHEVLMLALDDGRLHDLEEVLLGVGHDDCRHRAEVTEGHVDGGDFAMVVGRRGRGTRSCRHR
jgi:hypothetical protein